MIQFHISSIHYIACIVTVNPVAEAIGSTSRISDQMGIPHWTIMLGSKVTLNQDSILQCKAI